MKQERNSINMSRSVFSQSECNKHRWCNTALTDRWSKRNLSREKEKVSSSENSKLYHTTKLERAILGPPWRNAKVPWFPHRDKSLWKGHTWRDNGYNPIPLNTRAVHRALVIDHNKTTTTWMVRRLLKSAQERRLLPFGLLLR